MFKALKGLRHSRERVVWFLAAVRTEERERGVRRCERRSRRLLDSGRQALQGFRGSPRERVFVRRTSSERELGIQGLRVRSPLVKFFFHSEVCVPHGGEHFCG